MNPNFDLGYCYFGLDIDRFAALAHTQDVLKDVQTCGPEC